MLEINATVIVQIINLVIFFGLVTAFFYNPIMAAVKKRRETIENNISQAEQSMVEADKLKTTYMEKISELQTQGADILKQYREEGERLKSEIIQQARTEAQSLITNTTLEIENSREKALEELKGFSVTMAVSIAEKMLTDILDTQSQKVISQRLVQKFSEMQQGITVTIPASHGTEMKMVEPMEKVDLKYDKGLGSESIRTGVVRTGNGKEQGEPIPE